MDLTPKDERDKERSDEVQHKFRIGTCVKKLLPGYGVYSGIVTETGLDPKSGDLTYRVCYEGGNMETMSEEALVKIADT